MSSTQKFYDDLDGLIYETPEEESATEAENQTPGEELEEGRVRIGCTINTSPGTSEVQLQMLNFLYYIVTNSKSCYYILNLELIC